MSDFKPAADLEDIPENGVHGVEVDGRKIVLIRRRGKVYALEDRCSHEEFPLSAGEVTGDQITCMLHGARFELSTGKPKALPAVLPVKTYETRVEDGRVHVKLD